MAGIGRFLLGFPVSGGKTVGVAVVEQLGGLLAMAVYVVAMQHIFATMIFHTPEQSWVLTARKWWQGRQQELERRSLEVWTLPSAPDEPQAKQRSRED